MSGIDGGDGTQPDTAPESARPTAALVATELPVLLNPGSGTGDPHELADHLRRELPQARPEILGAGDDLEQRLEQLASSHDALGISGGDGSVAAAAQAALRHDIPLAVLPGGTLNHFATAIGITDFDSGVECVRAGSLRTVDAATIDGHVFLNIVGLGVWADFVRVREELDGRIGKKLGSVIAALRVVRRRRQISVTVDGRPVRAWMIFIGNCQFHEGGFDPLARDHFDDGTFDVRIAEAGRGSFVHALRVLLARSRGEATYGRGYMRYSTREVTITTSRDAEPIVFDGEVRAASQRSLVITKHDRPLRVFAPLT